MIFQSFLQESRRISAFLKERHGEKVTLIHVVDILDAIRSDEGLLNTVMITSEFVSPTIELMSKLDRRLKPLEDNGALTLIFRPSFPPHKEEEVVEVNAYKDDDNTKCLSANICTSLTANRGWPSC